MAERPLNNSERKACWSSRDEYFKCLDTNNENVDSCKPCYSKFEEHCPKRWVKYFIGQRKKEKLRVKLEKEGAVYSDSKA